MNLGNMTIKLQCLDIGIKADAVVVVVVGVQNAADLLIDSFAAVVGDVITWA